jgi:hypothetical protein
MVLIHINALGAQNIHVCLLSQQYNGYLIQIPQSRYLGDRGGSNEQRPTASAHLDCPS